MDLWSYTDELFHQTEADKAVDKRNWCRCFRIKRSVLQTSFRILREATLTVPESKYFQKGGKKEFIQNIWVILLAELQYMQRTYPNMKW